MEYKNIREGIFLSRPNRFIGIVDIDGNQETVHIKNTGRCKELLVKGNRVLLEKSDNPMRKTLYDLVSVYKDNKLINMDSQLPNAVIAEWIDKGNLFDSASVVKREVTYKNSRFDLCVEHNGTKTFIEVKGVTLENGGICMFPDAPTERGVKHIKELIDAVNDGYGAYIIFVIQFKGALSLSPNEATHPQFGKVLREAAKRGVKILAYDCNVYPGSVTVNSLVPIIL